MRSDSPLWESNPREGDVDPSGDMFAPEVFPDEDTSLKSVSALVSPEEGNEEPSFVGLISLELRSVSSGGRWLTGSGGVSGLHKDCVCVIGAIDSVMKDSGGLVDNESWLEYPDSGCLDG